MKIPEKREYDYKIILDDDLSCVYGDGPKPQPIDITAMKAEIDAMYDAMEPPTTDDLMLARMALLEEKLTEEQIPFYTTDYFYYHSLDSTLHMNHYVQPLVYRNDTKNTPIYPISYRRSIFGIRSLLYACPMGARVECQAAGYNNKHERRVCATFLPATGLLIPNDDDPIYTTEKLGSHLFFPAGKAEVAKALMGKYSDSKMVLPCEAFKLKKLTMYDTKTFDYESIGEVRDSFKSQTICSPLFSCQMLDFIPLDHLDFFLEKRKEITLIVVTKDTEGKFTHHVFIEDHPTTLQKIAVFIEAGELECVVALVEGYYLPWEDQSQYSGVMELQFVVFVDNPFVLGMQTLCGLPILGVDAQDSSYMHVLNRGDAVGHALVVVYVVRDGFSSIRYRPRRLYDDIVIDYPRTEAVVFTQGY